MDFILSSFCMMETFPKTLRCIFLVLCVPKAPLQNSVLISVLCRGHSSEEKQMAVASRFWFPFPRSTQPRALDAVHCGCPFACWGAPQSRTPPIGSTSLPAGLLILVQIPTARGRGGVGCLPPALRRKEEQLSRLCPETCSALSSSPSSLPETANARLLPEMSPVGTQKGCVHGDPPRAELLGGAKNHTYQASRSTSCSVLGGTGLAQPAGSQSLRSKCGASTPSWLPPPGAPRQGRRQSAALWPRQRTGPAGSHRSALLLRRPEWHDLSLGRPGMGPPF